MLAEKDIAAESTEARARAREMMGQMLIDAAQLSGGAVAAVLIFVRLTFVETFGRVGGS